MSCIQGLTYNLWIHLCKRLSARLERASHKSYTVNKSYFVLYDLPTFLPFYWHWEGYAFLSVFSQTFKLHFWHFCQLFGYKMLIIVSSVAKDLNKFFWHPTSIIIDIVCSSLTLSRVMAVVTHFFMIFVATMKSCTSELIKTIIINIKYCSITIWNLSGSSFSSLLSSWS